MSETIYNPLRKIRHSLKMGDTHEEIEEFLDFWVTLSSDEKRELRHKDLSEG